MNISPEFRLALNHYMSFIKDDYKKHSAMGDKESMVLEAQIGRRFIKILETGRQNRVHSFIVINDFTTSAKAGNKSFRSGDILMAATYWAPALNKARGNIMDLDMGNASWTGAGYLT